MTSQMLAHHGGLFWEPIPGLISHMSLSEGKMRVLQRATPERLSTFSDGVFAVLITVLVLELRPPELPTFKALLLLWPTWLSYAATCALKAVSRTLPAFHTKDALGIGHSG